MEMASCLVRLFEGKDLGAIKLEKDLRMWMASSLLRLFQGEDLSAIKLEDLCMQSACDGIDS